MKLIFRSDDVGFTDVANIGTFRCMEEGLTTTADVMLDCPGTEDALRRLRDFPWISVGWHVGHAWGKPVSDPGKIPSLLDENGDFRWTQKNSNTYKWNSKDLVSIKKTCRYEEALMEYRAQIERCIDILGRAPDTGGGAFGNPVDDAIRQVMDEYGIKYGWFTKGGMGSRPATPCLPQYEHLHIYMPSQGKGTNKYMGVRPSSDIPEQYDPMRGLMEDGDGIMDKEIAQIAFHPAYLDDYIMYDGGLDTIVSRIRPMDVHFLCSQELRDWIKENRVELINQRDALYGTHEYQNHLKAIGSDLCMI